MRSTEKRRPSARAEKRAPGGRRDIARIRPNRTTPLRSGRAPRRRAALPRTTPLRPGPWSPPPERAPIAASEAQREKIIGGWCVVCRQTRGITPAHLTPRALGGCDHPDCVVALCWLHRRAYDSGRLELLPDLEPDWRSELGHAVLHLGLIGAYRRLTSRRAA